jgi:hypothetical protein
VLRKPCSREELLQAVREIETGSLWKIAD